MKYSVKSYPDKTFNPNLVWYSSDNLKDAIRYATVFDLIVVDNETGKRVY